MHSSLLDSLRGSMGMPSASSDHALVLCVDEKKTALFAVLDIANGSGSDGRQFRQKHEQFLGFLRNLDQCVPEEFNVHVILDNYEAHKHPDVRAWLAQRPRYHVQCNSSYSSWVNQAERWVGTIAKGTIGRRPFISVKDQALRIDAFVQRYRRSSRPFVLGAAAADFFLQKIARVCARISAV